MDLLAVQGTFKILQHHSLKASILQHSAFFLVQLSHPYMTTGKNIAFTRRTFVGKIMSLLFNILSRLVIIFLPDGLNCCLPCYLPPGPESWESARCSTPARLYSCISTCCQAGPSTLSPTASARPTSSSASKAAPLSPEWLLCLQSLAQSKFYMLVKGIFLR